MLAEGVSIDAGLQRLKGSVRQLRQRIVPHRYRALAAVGTAVSVERSWPMMVDGGIRCESSLTVRLALIDEGVGASFGSAFGGGAGYHLTSTF